MLDGKTFDMTGVWENGQNAKFGYDFWYQPGHNVMVSSAWGAPKAWRSGFNPKHVEEGRPSDTSFCHATNKITGLATHQPVVQVTTPLEAA